MGWMLIISGLCHGRSTSTTGPAWAVVSSWVLISEECQVVLLDVPQQDLTSLLQGLEDLLQPLGATLALPEHRVHLQRLEQKIL